MSIDIWKIVPAHVRFGTNTFFLTSLFVIIPHYLFLGTYLRTQRNGSLSKDYNNFLWWNFAERNANSKSYSSFTVMPKFVNLINLPIKELQK